MNAGGCCGAAGRVHPGRLREPPGGHHQVHHGPQNTFRFSIYLDISWIQRYLQMYSAYIQICLEYMSELYKCITRECKYIMNTGGCCRAAGWVHPGRLREPPGGHYQADHGPQNTFRFMMYLNISWIKNIFRCIQHIFKSVLNIRQNYMNIWHVNANISEYRWWWRCCWTSSSWPSRRAARRAPSSSPWTAEYIQV